MVTNIVHRWYKLVDFKSRETLSTFFGGQDEIGRQLLAHKGHGHPIVQHAEAPTDEHVTTPLYPVEPETVPKATKRTAKRA